MFSVEPVYLLRFDHVRENLVLNLNFQGINIGQDVNREDRGRGASTIQDRIRRMIGSS